MLEMAAQRGKYARLYEFLKELKANEWTASFAEIEALVGFELPDSARIYRPWWANQNKRGSHTQALAWEMAGWKTSRVDMDAETLTFKRSAH